jgi:hypothetical protein
MSTIFVSLSLTQGPLIIVVVVVVVVVGKRFFIGTPSRPLGGRLV